MRPRAGRLLPGITAVLAALVLAPLVARAEAEYQESDFLSRVRRLTFEGRRAGEGYFSPDGGRLVFQSERHEDNPFYQIYLLDLATGESHLVSPGSGKTTCAFIHPGSGDILFGSTHHDPDSEALQRAEIETRASGEERRYAWDYDPEMEIWVAAADGSGYTRLTDVRGYDAEGSYSPDGEWIVFSSMRDAYNRELTDEETKLLELNPSYFAEIYLMRADGSDQRRLTDAAGYDGGPFFSADGSRIVWRRFDEEGLLADVWTMNPDGTDQRQVTDFGSMSWAPYTHPSGDYIFFASNKLGFSNFEIFIVDFEGLKEPVRVTYTDGFDGLPVPSPDGRRLAWTSTRHKGEGGQLYLAEWNHLAALEALERAPGAPGEAPLGMSGYMGENRSMTDLFKASAICVLGVFVAALLPAAGAGVLQGHVAYLTSDELEGRLTGTGGERQAADYIAAELEKLGAAPLPGRDDFLIPFDFTAGTSDDGSSLALRASEIEQEWAGTETIQALSFSENDSVTGGVVFAGYGLVMPESEDLGYDSYATLDVEDKIVLALRYFPEDMDQESRSQLARYSGLRYKALQARERGARALLVVSGPRSPNAGETVPMTFDTAVAGSGIVAASISGAVADRLFEHVAGKNLEQAQAALDDGNPHVAGFEIPGIELTLDVKVKRERRTGHNVAGVLAGSDPGAADKAYVVLGAHYDHLGRGNNGNSLARKEEAGGVHYGADDNASGAAALLAAGARLAGMEHRRNVVLAFWSGEELGLLGATAFLNGSKNGSENGPESGPAIARESMAGYVNMDMVGRMKDNRLTVQAVGSSSIWPRLIEQSNVPIGFDIQTNEDPYLPTDSTAFNSASVPTLNLFTGSHEDYHRPSDTADKINYEDLARVAQFGALVTHKLANLDAAPDFVKVAPRTDRGGSRDAVRAFTGTIPDYTTEVEGLRLSGVIEGGPAAEAGLREGDVIVEFGGQKIANIYDYTYALDAVKIGEPIKVVFLREGERQEETIVPRARK